jgi:hypothetical protein
MVVAERKVIASRALGEERELWIHLPRGYAEGNLRYPVLYVLDGQGLTVGTAGQTEILARGENAPAIIVVGISSTTSQDRQRNFRPGKEGRADEFLGFLVDEVKPMVEKSYRTEPFALLAGHSLGGLFALHALAVRPDSFSAYIAVSPPLGSRDRIVLGETEALLARAPATRAHVFVAMGDEGARFPREPFDAFTALMARAKEPLRWRPLHLPGETHTTTFLPALWAALRWIYAGWDTNETTVAAIETHYQRLTKRLGYPIPVPEGTWNRVGYELLAAKNPAGAVAVFEKMTRDYPKSANAWDSLAEGYEAAGRKADAEKARQTKARVGR